MRAFRVEDLPIESKMLTKALDEAQRKVENYFFDIRKQLFEFDEVLNSQRDRVYTERRRALESDNLQSLIIEYAELTMDDILEVCGPSNFLLFFYMFFIKMSVSDSWVCEIILFINRQILVQMLQKKAGILRSSSRNFNSKLHLSISELVQKL